MPPDLPQRDLCGRCQRCRTACPTDALAQPYRLDPRRCLAYWTIEHHGPIPLAFRPAMGNRVFGCDACLAACPWNRFAQASAAMLPAPRQPLRAIDLAALARLDGPGFVSRFAGTPVRRLGLARLLRNVMIAIGNSGDPALARAAKAHVGHPDPVVAEAAAWALDRLGGTKAQMV